MRKRFMNLSKRCMVAIMSAAMLMSSVTVSMAFPVGVYATMEDNDYDIGSLDFNLRNNNGYIDQVLEGFSVQTNNGSIDTNNGTVVDNKSNNGNSPDIILNKGTVVNNYGMIGDNRNTVSNNYGIVSNNKDSAVITNQYAGTVSGNGTITNFFDGTIEDGSNVSVTNNFADITTDTPAAAVNAANQYLSVTLTDMDGANATYNAEQFTAANNKQYLKVKNNGEAIENVQGTIELSAKQGYSLSLADSFPVNETYGYELNMDEGKYYLTIYRPTASLTISPENIGLVISQLKKAGILPKNTDVEVTTSNVDVNDSAQDTSVSRPAVVNPNAIGAFYYMNGILVTNATIGKTEQGSLAKAVFNASIPLGWNSAFSFNLSINGKNEYSKKDGTIVLYVPSELQKEGREYKILAMDKNGKVFEVKDSDTNPNVVTFTPNIEGYAYYLIYKD